MSQAQRPPADPPAGPLLGPAPGESVAGTVLHVPDTKICLSTSSVYPESTAAAFEIAAGLGFDGVEVMVGIDPVSQDAASLRHLAEYHSLEIIAIHAPCLLITQRVWGTDPWVKLDRAREVGEELGASVVVVHPPFRWQRDYARAFEEGLARMADETDVKFAVENMYPWRAGAREVQAYAPDWDIVDRDYPAVTLDLSHTSTSHSDPLAMIPVLGDRLCHVHMADGHGTNKDEHLIPGRGNQPCAEVLEMLARQGFGGSVVLEVNTRRCANREQREADLMEALAFTRLHLAAAVDVGPGDGASADGARIDLRPAPRARPPAPAAHGSGASAAGVATSEGPRPEGLPSDRPPSGETSACGTPAEGRPADGPSAEAGPATPAGKGPAGGTQAGGGPGTG